MYYFEKVAKQVKEKDEAIKDNAKSLGAGAVGVKMMHSSKDRILGQKTLYHGTSKENWENIKKEGLKANRGGVNGAGAAIGNVQYMNSSKNKVHLTGSKMKAEAYSRLPIAAKNIENSKEKIRLDELTNKHTKDVNKGPVFDSFKDMDEYLEANRAMNKKLNKEMFNPKTKGKKIKIKMDYNKYRGMEIDPDEAGGAMIEQFGNKIKNKKMKNVAEGIARHQAARGSFDIGKNEIVGLHKTSKRLKGQIKNMPNYIKTNKGRFGAGVALAGTGAALVGKSVSNMKQNNSKKIKGGNVMNKTRKYKEAIYKEASVNSKDNDNRTKWMKDRVMPAIKSEVGALKGGAIAAGIGAAGAMAGSKATSSLIKHVSKKKGIPSPNSPVYKALVDPKFKKARLGVSAAVGAANLAPSGAKAGRVIGDMKTLEKKTRSELHREPTEKEYKAVARLDESKAFDRKLGRLINNPNAIVKSNLREGK